MKSVLEQYVKRILRLANKKPTHARSKGIAYYTAAAERINELDYGLARDVNRNLGEKALFGMMSLRGAFRFIEQLYAKGEIDFLERRMAGQIICERYERLRQESYIYLFSRSNCENVGCL